MLYFDETTQQATRLRQCLSVFFDVYAMSTPAHKKIICKAMIRAIQITAPAGARHFNQARRQKWICFFFLSLSLSLSKFKFIIWSCLVLCFTSPFPVDLLIRPPGLPVMLYQSPSAASPVPDINQSRRENPCIHQCYVA